MRKTHILGIAGLTLFFLVLSVLYGVISYAQEGPKILEDFAPLVVLSGFFIFLIGAFLMAFSIFKAIDKWHENN